MFHGLSGGSAELFNLTQPLTTEPDMRAVLASLNRPRTTKYLDRWSAVRRELRSLLDDPYIRMAARPPRERANLMGWDLDGPVETPTNLALRLYGLDHAAEVQAQTAALDRRILAAFPELRGELD